MVNNSWSHVTIVDPSRSEPIRAGSRPPDPHTGFPGSPGYLTGEYTDPLIVLACDCGQEFSFPVDKFPGRRKVKDCGGEDCPYAIERIRKKELADEVRGLRQQEKTEGWRKIHPGEAQGQQDSTERQERQPRTPRPAKIHLRPGRPAQDPDEKIVQRPVGMPVQLIKDIHELADAYEISVAEVIRGLLIGEKQTPTRFTEEMVEAEGRIQTFINVPNWMMIQLHWRAGQTGRKFTQMVRRVLVGLESPLVREDQDSVYTAK